MITVVGLGYDKDCVSVKGLKAIESADKLFVLTEKTAAGVALKQYNPVYMDDLFETAADFDALQAAIVARLSDGCVYATDGTGYSDGAVKLLTAAGKATVIPGSVESADCALVLTATDAATALPYLDTAAVLVVTELDDAILAGELKLKLSEFYPDDFVCLFGPSHTPIAFCELDRQPVYDAATQVVFPASAALDKKTACFGDIRRMMARLTAPDGCPWDKAQTHGSIRQNLIEEAYEAVDAIDGGNIDDMIEELGDVFLQAVFHCDIGARTGECTLGEVMSNLLNKLYFRHTHIFGDVRAADAKEALGAWESAKAEEKSYTSVYDILCRMPKGFPAALRAGKAVKKAVKGGDDLTEASLKESAAAAIRQGDYADALFCLCGAAALGGVEPETAVNARLKTFIEEHKA